MKKNQQKLQHRGPSHKDPGVLLQLENWLDEVLVKKAPVLPDNFKEVLVKVAPWFIIIGLLLSIPVLIALLGFSSMIPGVTVTGMHGMAGFTSMVIIIPLAILFTTLVLQIMALPGLFNRQYRGWQLIFYANLIGLVATVLSFTLGGLLIDVIVFYLLFQIREKYKK